MLSVDASPLLLLAAALTFYKLYIYVYRITLSPLASIPGPKLAALTGLYEGYYDLVKDGQYPWRIREMHAKYGKLLYMPMFRTHEMLTATATSRPRRMRQPA